MFYQSKWVHCLRVLIIRRIFNKSKSLTRVTRYPTKWIEKKRKAIKNAVLSRSNAALELLSPMAKSNRKEKIHSVISVVYFLIDWIWRHENIDKRNENSIANRIERRRLNCDVKEVFWSRFLLKGFNHLQAKISIRFAFEIYYCFFFSLIFSRRKLFDERGKFIYCPDCSNKKVIQSSKLLLQHRWISIQELIVSLVT